MAHLRIMVLAALVLALFSVSTAAAQDDTTLTMIVTRDPVSLDPQTTLDPGAPILLAYIYDTLVYQTPTGEVLPSLAEDWTLGEDNLSITFNLRPGIQFSNGEPLNAEAVIYTFERLQGVGQRSLIYDEISNITSFEAADDLTVTFQLAQPSATLLSALTYPYAGILEPSAVEAAGESYGQNPVGTGSFMLDSWVSESEMTLIPNPNYAGHRPWTDAAAPPTIDRLLVRFSADESARVNALLAGEADVIYVASGGQVARASESGTVLESPARALVYLGFNTGAPHSITRTCAARSNRR
ncbi:MAG: ABC transporter substrate-binding protein [Blastochloris sp.]|nr:ABC transporter substrate-binding protein [Blastochloris sp.]